MSIPNKSCEPAQQALSTTYLPLATVRCVSAAVFRSQAARDVACLFDVDRDIDRWECLPSPLRREGHSHQPDFAVHRAGQTTLVDVSGSALAEASPEWTKRVAEAQGYRYDLIDYLTLPPVRLKNARDLLRYARFEVALSDRIRILTVLDEYSEISISECITIFEDRKPMAALASLALHRFIEIDLDDKLIGPETRVRRMHD